MLHRGELPYVCVRVAEDAETADLIGVCVVDQRPFERDFDAAYIALIALSSTWRGHRLADGTRLGAFLLGDALDQIKAIWDGPPMPAVWALIAPDNQASHKTFAAWGFACVRGYGGGYDVRYRPGIGSSA